MSETRPDPEWRPALLARTGGHHPFRPTPWPDVSATREPARERLREIAAEAERLWSEIDLRWQRLFVRDRLGDWAWGLALALDALEELPRLLEMADTLPPAYRPRRDGSRGLHEWRTRRELHPYVWCGGWNTPSAICAALRRAMVAAGGELPPVPTRDEDLRQWLQVAIDAGL